MELDPRTGSVSIANAGHPPALLVTNADGNFLDADRGPALGLSAVAAYTETHLTMGHQDRLILFTDGLVESRTTDLDINLQQLRTASQRAHRDLDTLLDGLLAAMRPTDSDDVTLLGVAFQRS